ncbi:hypothetical protein [Pedobacter paludis]|uniref:Uncharacterized protein n=1 Tax=Pedobacter paludis TaxID=2203212 RepID=A0A317F640_9SPHI|nr:hypothetical protein [Pedobacter paludis]PWS33369.1 hypothetical protein DF947_01715 [Pedobacter paludis]
MQFVKKRANSSLEDFLTEAAQVKNFKSSTGRAYQVLDIVNHQMSFLRLDAKSDAPWVMDLKAVYRAYQELDDFETLNFKKYVPRRHSPARGLLLHLQLLTPKVIG